MLFGAVAVVAGLLVAFELPELPDVSATLTMEGPSDIAAALAQAAATRHLTLEVVSAALAVLVLAVGLGKTDPRANGLFRFHTDPQTLVSVAVLCLVAFPLADPAVYQLSRYVEQTYLGVSMVPPPAAPALVQQLQLCTLLGDWPSLGLHFLASCAVGPWWEELFWRGFFLASMTRVLPLQVSMAVSSGVFAALHYGAPGNLLPVLLLSALCDALYLRTASLAAPLLLHSAWNAYQLGSIAFLGKDTFV